MKKYLKCVGYAVAVMLILATLYITFAYMEESLAGNVMDEVNRYSREYDKKIPELMDIGDRMEEAIGDYIHEDKVRFGNEYPAEGIFLYRLTSSATNEVVSINLFAALVGIVYGTVYYIIAVQKVTGKKLVLELLAALVIILLVVEGTLFIYNLVLNNLVRDLIEDASYKVESELHLAIPLVVLYVACIVIVFAGIAVLKRFMEKKNK